MSPENDEECSLSNGPNHKTDMMMYLVVAVLVVVLPLHCSALAAHQVPITVLSGFLGSGKTTLLKHLLENKEGLKIAVIVNDMAEVNIDSKLVAGAAQDNIVQLQNGCACCTQSEELLGSVAELITLSDMRGERCDFDHIVIELSGIADPGAVRSKFQEAMMYDMPIMERVRLDTLVTLVDCSTFWDYFQSSKTITETPELAPPPFEEDVDDSIIPMGLLETMGAGTMDQQDSAVSSLLVTQAETADILLLNKIDLVDDTSSMEELLRALNPKARVFGTQYGRLPWRNILGAAKGQGAVLAGVVDDHKDSVKHAEEHHSHNQHDNNRSEDSHHDHSHSHSHGHSAHEPHTPASGATQHQENHDHGHSAHEPHASASSTTQHKENHDHTGHSTHHSHEEHQADVCNNPDCTDETHTHDHSYVGGIGSFVYRGRRPFHPERLASWMQHLPVRRGVPQDVSPMNLPARGPTILGSVVRSKGFYWQADSHAAALFWSQAGSSLDLHCLGSWWATLPRYRWPASNRDEILADFDDPEHDDEDNTGDSVGDRRQEIVFIGASLGEASSQSVIIESLNRCLLTDEEWDAYLNSRSDEDGLARLFPSPHNVAMMTY